MPEFKIAKESGTKFDILMSVDYDEDGNIETQEFYDGEDWFENPSEIRFANSYCDNEESYDEEIDLSDDIEEEDEEDYFNEEILEEWNIFINDLMHLFETNQLNEKIEKLKEIDDSYFFSEEEIEVTLVEEDL